MQHTSSRRASGSGTLAFHCSLTFILLFAFAALASAQVTFDKPDIDVGRGAASVAVGDINHDGHLDIVTANNSAKNITVLLNRGDNTFARTDYPLSSTPTGVKVADINGDGFADVAVSGNAGVTIFTGNAAGTLTFTKQIGTGSPATGLLLADLTRDGMLDLAVVTTRAATSDSLLIYVGDGTGNFHQTSESVIKTGPGGGFGEPGTIVTVDFNGDGVPDIAMTSDVLGFAAVFVGHGDGTFSRVADVVPASGQAARIGVGDMNQDGKADLVVSAINCEFRECQTVAQIYTGVGNGTFSPGSPIGPVNVDAFTVADVNGDRVPDLVGGLEIGGIEVDLTMPGTGAPQFSTATFAAGPIPSDIALGDFNGDGMLDVVTANLSTVTLIMSDGHGGWSEHLRSPMPTAGPLQATSLDINRDGNPDIVFSADIRDGVYAALGRGDGTFAPAQPIVQSFSGAAVGSADVNGDGIMDLVVSGNDLTVQPFSLRTRILLGKGDGTFTQAYEFVGATGILQAPVIADLNHDGKPDIVLLQGSKVSVALGNGDGTFQPTVETVVNPDTTNQVFTQAIAVADFDSDSRADLIVTYGSVGTPMVKLFRGNGDGSFQTGEIVSGPGQLLRAQWAVAADFNHDGNADVAVSHRGSLAMFLGDGHGHFRQLADATAGGPGTDFFDGMLTADVNGDGIPDLLFNESGVVDVLLGKGDGTFKPVQKFDSGGGFVFTTGDFNHDGKTDVAVVSSWISTLLNTTGNVVPPPPTGGADFTFALGTSALAVNRGQSASTSMSLAATGGLNDSVTFSCAGLPQGATCSFSPASVTVAGSAQQTVTLTITTAAARAALARDGAWTQMLAFVLPFGFVLIGSGRRTRGMLKRLRAVWLMLAIAGLLALQGCGGVGGSNNSGGTPPPPPPPNTGQTFTVTVSATSANTHITHTQNIALEVR